MKPGLFAALLASMSVSEFDQIDPSKINADQIRLLQTYVSSEIRDLVGDALSIAKKQKRHTQIGLPLEHGLPDQEEELQALSLIYSGYTGYQVTITLTKISVKFQTAA